MRILPSSKFKELSKSFLFLPVFAFWNKKRNENKTFTLIRGFICLSTIFFYLSRSFLNLTKLISCKGDDCISKSIESINSMDSERFTSPFTISRCWNGERLHYWCFKTVRYFEPYLFFLLLQFHPSFCGWRITILLLNAWFFFWGK